MKPLSKEEGSELQLGELEVELELEVEVEKVSEFVVFLVQQRIG
jgi:hypothetical protein